MESMTHTKEILPRKGISMKEESVRDKTTLRLRRKTTTSAKLRSLLTATEEVARGIRIESSK